MTEQHEYNTVDLTQKTTNEAPNNEQVQAGITPTGQRLRAYFERIERLEESKKEIAEDIKEVFAEAKGDGFDVKAMRKIISIRKKDPADLEEENAILETYMSALGMKF